MSILGKLNLGSLGGNSSGGRASEILLNGTETLAPGGGSGMMNLGIGGQFGPMTNPNVWLSNTPYIREHAIVRILEYPKGFELLDDGDAWRACLKELVETRAMRWEGFKFGITTEYDDVPHGMAGEIFETPKNATRARSEPVLTTSDFYGGAVSTFWNEYKRLLIMEPETKRPGIFALDKSTEINDWTPDYYTFSIIVIEPNPTGRQVVRAVICYNMAPKDETEIEMKFDPTSEKERPEVSVNFTCISEPNTNSVRSLAQSILSGDNGTGAGIGLSPVGRESFISEISEEVRSTGGGAAAIIEDAARVST